MATFASLTHHLSPTDLQHLLTTAQLSQTSCGQTQPHPNAACLIVDSQTNAVLASSSLWASGCPPPECIALSSLNSDKQVTVYLNLETGDCHGDTSGVEALIHAKRKIDRIVIGMRHPLFVHRGVAIKALREAGIRVDVLGETPAVLVTNDGNGMGTMLRTEEELRELERKTVHGVVVANEALLHRAVLKRPLGILKYAMTLDGKIAASSGHSAWVSSKDSRQVVFRTRARSDAVVVGGQTVRRDDPRLTTRQESGHQPVRVVMSRTLDLPDNAAVWDVTLAPTIVATQRGVRREFQRELRSRGVEVLEFDFLTPAAVADYCYERGFLTILWECGGTLAAPAIAGGAVHKVLAFIAPKIIGGTKAPTPVGDLGFVEMTQALEVVEGEWEQVGGRDLMMRGYLPASGGPLHLRARLEGKENAYVKKTHSSNNGSIHGASYHSNIKNHGKIISFYKAWDAFGALSNFSPHPVILPQGPMTHELLDTFRPSVRNTETTIENGIEDGQTRVWPSTEHYYQAQKFSGVPGPEAIALCEEIAKAPSPEEAAAIGRRFERTRPDLLREDWSRSKIAAMHAALRAKFASYEGPRALLLSQDFKDSEIVESAPHDYFWGKGVDGSGQNMLGKLLMKVREELEVMQKECTTSVV